MGQTPEVKNTGARYSVNMISVVSAKGALRFAVYEGNTNAAVFIDFCKRLLHDAPGPVYLIVDGHPAHRATATKEFTAKTEGRLKLFFLPGYSPELNPDEWVWKNVKHDRIGKTGVTSRQDLICPGHGQWRRFDQSYVGPRMGDQIGGDPLLQPCRNHRPILPIRQHATGSKRRDPAGCPPWSVRRSSDGPPGLIAGIGPDLRW